MYEMASISTKKTGLPLKIWVSTKGKTRHSARIKVSSLCGDKLKPDATFTITIEDDPKIIGSTGNIKTYDLEKVKDFVIMNKNALLMHWNELLDTDELLDVLVHD